MILSELSKLYDRYVDGPSASVPHRFWSFEKAAFRICLDAQGEVVSIVPYVTGEGKEERKFVVLEVPEHVGRTSKVTPYFLCDTAAYFFGLGDKKSKQRFQATADFHLDLLEQCSSDAARAVRQFFQHGMQKDGLSDSDREPLEKGGFCVFEYLPDRCLVHDVPDVREVWNAYCRKLSQGQERVVGQCSITGEVSSLARLYPQVTGFPGANSAGASLVSFNQRAFDSYGKSQAYNASISETAAYKSGTALKALLSDSTRRARLGNMQLVYWSDRPSPSEDSIIFAMFNELHDSSKTASGKQDAEDRPTLDKLHNIVLAMQKGRPVVGYDFNTRYFILGLSPNAARLSVRFFYTETFGRLAEHYLQYLDDVSLDGLERFSLGGLLRQTTALGRENEIPSTLLHDAYAAMLTGGQFPFSLRTVLLSRMRADQGGRHPWDMRERAALLKAILVRKQRIKGEVISKETEITMSLNRENTNIGYLLGRLFAVVERTQELSMRTDGGGSVNATVRDKYIGAAAATPSRVFPHLFGNYYNHLAKIRKNNPGRAVSLEKEMGEVLDGLKGEGAALPKTLDMDDQGAFYVGYVHERQSFFKRREDGGGADVKSDDVSTAEITR